MTPPSSLAGTLLAAFLQDGSAPRLTWYGADGERCELSGRVLGNWVTKAANLLAEEADARPGTAVVIDLPVHWRALVWALGTWTAGGRVVLPGATDQGADVIVTAQPGHDEREGAADLVLAVALPALAMRWTGPELTAGAVDAAAALMTYADVLGHMSEPDEDDVALVGEELEATFGELSTWARGSAELGRPARDGEDDLTPVRALVSPSDLAGLVEQALAVWRAGGSLVLAEPGTSEESLERIAAEERVDLRW